MTLTDLVRSLPVARDIIQSVASVLQPSVRSSATVSIATLGLGMALGAGVALLCAPKSGRELRRQLFARLDGAGHEVEDLDEPSPSRAKEGSGRGRSNSRSDDLHPEIDA